MGVIPATLRTTIIKLRMCMGANFIALESSVDGGASISWKL